MFCRVAQHYSLLGSLITSTDFVVLVPGTYSCMFSYSKVNEIACDFEHTRERVVPANTAV